MKNEHGLTPQQETFAVAIGSGKSQAEAYRIAYPRALKWQDKTVWSEASTLAKHPKVAARVAGLQKAAADKAVFTAADILIEIKRIAKSDIGGIFDRNGKLKKPHELDEATRAAIASVEFDKDGGFKYRFWDKNAALEKAAKHLGLFTEDNRQRTDPLAQLLARLKGNVFTPVADAALPDDDEG